MTEAQKQESANQILATSGKYEIRLMPPTVGNLPLGFAPYLYNTARHLATKRVNQGFSVGLWDPEAQRITALFHANHDGQEATSLPDAPFGSLDYAEGVPYEALAGMLAAIESLCRQHDLTRLTIKLPPGSYDEARFAFLCELYERQGFSVVGSFQNHHIAVDEGNFVHKIHPSERKRLRKCQRTGLTAEEWQNPDPAQVFAFLAESRKRQGYALSLHSWQLEALLTGLPEEVKVFVVKDGLEIASLTVAIRVSRRILYNFCPADNYLYRSFSPTVLLNCALYRYAQSEGIELIDLGVSLDRRGNEKASLIRFKENLGGRSSLKATYGKYLT